MKYDWEANKARVTDSTGRRLTVGLFKELADVPADAPFSIADWQKVYIDIADPTEYKAAMALIGNWEHWLALCKSPPFLEHLSKWRVEVEAKLASEAVDNLRRQAKHEKGTAAAKWLAEKGFAEKQRGRPRKDAQQGALDNQQVERDARRLGLVAGGKAA